MAASEEDELAKELDKLSINEADKDKDSEAKHETEDTDGLKSVDLEGIAEYIKSEKCKNIIVMTGAGISVSAGIPDFRTPGSGLYDNLQKYNLSRPEDIFTISFFKENPQPFCDLARELYPGNFDPTPTHHFISLLHKKGLLLRSFTQNIDGLERIAGVPGSKMMEAHGTFSSATCLDCSAPQDVVRMKGQIFDGDVPSCAKCKGLVKPDIVFFGEALPRSFATRTREDFPKCDLLIVSGTSLAVSPFNTLIHEVGSDVPRLLINKEMVGHIPEGGGGGDDLPPMLAQLLGIPTDGFHFTWKDNKRDVFHENYCDEGFRKLADFLGWREEFEKDISTFESAKKDKEGK